MPGYWTQPLEFNPQPMSYYNERNARTYIDQHGYRRFCDSHKPVSRWVAERKLGRRLGREEVVHHIDRNKSNNCPNNLWVFQNQAAHHRVHELDARHFGHEYSYRGRRAYW
ncbi:MAG: hypothetical protein EOO04_07480 [Chitinophagaceae bacterium]|nr:MAG: hypothetical protein EOO04_07480 [Chitinophagaceae bacterium]